MTAKLQVHLDEELVVALKIYAIQQKRPMKEIVAEALREKINAPVPKTLAEKKEMKKKTPKPQPKKEEAPTPVSQFYTLRKTARVGKPRTEMFQHNFKGFTWLGLEGCRDHFDADGNIIPIRFTGEFGEVCEPEAADLQELSEALGMPVVVEE